MLLTEPQNQSNANKEFFDALEQYWHNSSAPLLAKLENFPKYVSRESITKFLARAMLFQKQLLVHGSVIELGVARGGGLFTWAHLSSIFEPTNYTREIIGFDTFSGIPAISPQDRASDRPSSEIRPGGFCVEPDTKLDIERAVSIHDLTRYLGHIPKVRLIPGAIEDTAGKFLEDNPHTIISLLNIDVDVYTPTSSALRVFLPRIPKGGMVIFDEINNRLFPGETSALFDVVGVNSLSLQRFSFCPALSYAIL